MLMVGRDRDRVDRDSLKHFLGRAERMFETVLGGSLACAVDIDIADRQQFRLIEQRQRVGVRIADPSAADQPETCNLRHLFEPLL